MDKQKMAVKNRRQKMAAKIEATPMDKQKMAGIPHVHKLSHKLKKIAEQSKVRVVFSAVNKLGKQCRLTDSSLPTKLTCNKTHKNALQLTQKALSTAFRWTVGKGILAKQAGASMIVSVDTAIT